MTKEEAQPHMAWCPQSEEYAKWYQALHDKGPNTDVTGLAPGKDDK